MLLYIFFFEEVLFCVSRYVIKPYPVPFGWDGVMLLYPELSYIGHAQLNRRFIQRIFPYSFLCVHINTMLYVLLSNLPEHSCALRV